jgi:hypothetical protein
MVHAFLAPPLHKLAGIGERLKDPVGWSGDVNFGLNRVLIVRHCRGCHESYTFPVSANCLSFSTTPAQPPL